ncbi:MULTISPECIES: 16S rRNA (cytidine(1402)-2'-O)-methyltransferase [Roseobacter]|uniref:Ribosomal RNA small subunit methyltransferase I n=1 Tax=Roseobacter litoralis (strain ATCC 49566 / DSM 6996 / JCM 21268 / NBRC 15278 / OCh 149) TaxID=391595 RepID=F7ZAY6_ROSLO|nr:MULTISPECIES: 16S rRNA (cytidine(1402)-2'-O)-methyltransferase [Roseobacter]AEI95528.1 ribosomal RNA small subunit methyltransferase I [Roseobacter litoralis Och 149]GIT89360.1 ribosomal RNA small subunit methyltransferase I [Roseobacter sp. OBYS 0001]
MNFQKVSLAAGLYFVGVPIGTARDITLRALDVLASADVLAAEDTRSLRRLMEIHAVPLAGRQVISLHDHTGGGTSTRLIEAITAGASVAYASEAGMPLIADPGFELGRAAHAAEQMVTCAPGPSAVLTALVLAGLPTDAFFFAGFMPNAKAARRRGLEDLRDIPATLVFYESPKRLAAFLLDAADVLGGERQASVCREITKKFEETRKGTLSQLASDYVDQKVKGEIVVLIDRNRSEKITDSDLELDLTKALAAHSMRDAVDLVAKAHSIPRRQVYQMALALNEG